jgi:hypothetical protein
MAIEHRGGNAYLLHVEHTHDEVMEIARRAADVLGCAIGVHQVGPTVWQLIVAHRVNHVAAVLAALRDAAHPGPWAALY